MAARKKAKAKTTKTTKTTKTAKKAPAKKATAKKAPAKKTTAKKAPAKKATKKTAVKKVAKSQKAIVQGGKISVGSKPFTKSEFITTIVEQTGLNRKDISRTLDVISQIVECHLKKSGPESFTFPGLVKMQIVNKPAKKARKGTNPFTGEEMMFKAKPASRKVKLRPLKQLKEMAQ